VSSAAEIAALFVKRPRELDRILRADVRAWCRIRKGEQCYDYITTAATVLPGTPIIHPAQASQRQAGHCGTQTRTAMR
jgi:hypothetical protein